MSREPQGPVARGDLPDELRELSLDRALQNAEVSIWRPSSYRNQHGLRPERRGRSQWALPLGLSDKSRSCCARNAPVVDAGNTPPSGRLWSIRILDIARIVIGHPTR